MDEGIELGQPAAAPSKASRSGGYLTLEELRAEARGRRLRLAFFVTALPLELSAVRAHLIDLGAVRAHDGTIFECGTFTDRGQDWLIVMGETRAGTHNAQQVVSIGHSAFRSIGRFELMVFVGIGGSRKKGAPIGSVVAADKVYYPYGGKYTGGMLASRPDARALDYELINIAQKVCRDELWSSRIKPSKRGPMPGGSNYPVEFPPSAKVAPIASIEAVLDDPGSELEALLKSRYGDTHVVEMEGYGAVFSAHTVRTPGMILRGVSDMTEKKSDHDDDIFQPIAATHAAAFAFEMLSHWGMNNEAPDAASRSSTPMAGKGSEEGTPGVASAILDPSTARGRMLPSIEETSAPSTNEPGASSVRVEISVVLNLSADFGPENRERLDRLEQSLREIVGSQRVRIVEARAGSLLLFVADPDGALSGIGDRRLREALLEREDVHLIGMVPIAPHLARDEQLSDLDAASVDLLSWPTSLPDGELLDRPELTRLTSRLKQNGSSTTAVIGAAGAGKSALLATLGKTIRASGWPVLAIKADLLDPSIVNEDDLRQRLGLQRTPSTILRDLAAFGPVLLIVDQLDALAGYLDVRTARLNLLLNMIRKLGRVNNIHIVVSSRAFEFQHDVRLRAVDAESLELGLPPWNEVLAVLDARGVAAAGWPADAQEVMRFPQALSTYLLLNSRYSSEPFTSYQLMLDRLWAERVLAGGGERDRLASDIAEAMAEQESLWLAASRFAERTADIQALTAAGILTAIDGSVGFSHQTLFEFTLARSFAREPGRLSGFARERQSSLFLRPKLWAGLSYLRGVDRDLYHQEIEATWRIEGLRAHLRLLLIDFLGSQQQPTDREALLMESAVEGDATRLRAFRALSGSAGWFNRFADSHIASAMRSDERSGSAQMDVLARALPSAPGKVTQLLRAHWLPDIAKDLWTWSVIQWISPWTDDALDIALTLIGRTDMASSAIDHQTASIAVEQPSVALRLVRARLDRELDVASAEAWALASMRPPPPDGATLEEQVSWRLGKRDRDPVRTLIEQNHDWHSLSGIAEKWPQETINALWPWFVRALEELDRLNGTRHRVGFPLGFEADFRFEGENDLELPEGSILGPLRIAVEALADVDVDAFRRWIGEVSGTALTPVQRLVAHGIAHRPEALAEAGLNFVLGDERRYFLGSVHDLQGTIKRMVAAVSPHWTPEQVKRFEDQVRAYAPTPPTDETDPKARMRWRHMMRRTQLDLLRSLPTHQRSIGATRQVVEDERRYGTGSRGASFTGVQTVGSVLEAEDMAKASDDEVVNAFVELPDATGWDNPRRWMVGGNVQLARAFATFAKDNGDRSVRILSRLNKDNGARAAAYAIGVLAEASPPNVVFGLMRDFVAKGFDGEEFRHSVARAIEGMSRRKIDVEEDLLELLESWAASPPASGQADDKDANDDASDTETVGEKDEDAAIGESLLWGHGGLHAVPGGDVPIAEAVVHVRLLRQQPDKALDFMSDYLVRQKSIKAWEMLARYLKYLGGVDAARREAFLDRVLTEVQGVVGSKPFAQFLAAAQLDSHPLVERHLDAWKDSSRRAVRQAYGEMVGLDAILHTDHRTSRHRLDQIINDPAALPAQVGAALSAAHILAEDADRRGEAARLLARLLALPNSGVWPAAFEFFRLTDELVADEATVLVLHAIADGLPRSPTLDPTFVVDRLATLLPHQATLVGRIALGLVGKWTSELGDIRTSTAMAASALVDLAVTLHRLGPETREVGLKLLEQLLDIDAYGARQMLDEVDNRFRANASVARPRVRRRHEVAPRPQRRPLR